MDIREQLPDILPLAVRWAEEMNELGQARGALLDDDRQKIARDAGVARPERIRILQTAQMPQPDHPLLREASRQTGLLGPDTTGLTLGYTIFLQPGYLTTRLLSHEFRHVHQYETFGSIAKFLAEYLRQIVEYGYYDAPLEVDAREHEVSG